MEKRLARSSDSHIRKSRRARLIFSSRVGKLACIRRLGRHARQFSRRISAPRAWSFSSIRS